MFEGGMKRYRIAAAVLAAQMDEDFSIRTTKGILKGCEGDYLCRGPSGKMWPLPKELFESIYVLDESGGENS